MNTNLSRMKIQAQNSLGGLCIYLPYASASQQVGNYCKKSNEQRLWSLNTRVCILNEYVKP